MKIVLISGSASPHSHTTNLLNFLDEIISSKGIDTELIELIQFVMPNCNPEFHRSPEDHSDTNVKKFVNLIHKADAILIGTPNYHNSYSGILKNALDHLNFDQLKGKVVGLVCNGGGKHRNVQPLDHLRIVMRAFNSIVIPNQIATCRADYIGGELAAEDIKRRCQAFVNELVSFHYSLNSISE
ncbi:NADPH-dependent FMN reductase [Bacillus sp. NPDC077027]|uniref:NADPH-dependent FMN reductase n=1 Tax=Bacillus sp. NPDC077027 TaxID=3390548 RepID=UPI003D0123D7